MGQWEKRKGGGGAAGVEGSTHIRKGGEEPLISHV